MCTFVIYVVYVVYRPSYVAVGLRHAFPTLYEAILQHRSRTYLVGPEQGLEGSMNSGHIEF